MRLWRRAALPIVLSVFGLAWAAAHALIHDLVSSPEGAHGGHGGPVEQYAAYLPTSLALCLALAVALAAGLALSRRWSGLSGPAIWLFGLVPVLGFAADALIGLPANDSVSGTALVELVPVIVIGLLVQIPFALTAFGIGAAILLLAERLAWSFAGSGRTDRPGGRSGLRPACTDSLSGLLLAGADRSRAPPFPAAS